MPTTPTGAQRSRPEVEAVRARLDLVKLVSRYVSLRPRGKDYVGRCPFHEERTPSFAVSADKGLFHCFGCGAGGDAFEFLMKVERLTFPEALQQLAQEVGVPLQGGLPSSERERLQALNERVCRYFQRQLAGPAGAAARAYLSRRGVGQAAVEAFRLGYAPPGWQGLCDQFRRERQDLEALGLLVRGRKGKGRFYDRFRDRLIFPLCDVRGRVAGFAGRALASAGSEGQEQEQEQEQTPKYLNTPNTLLFEKGTLLYGLHLAREAAQARGYLILMEGYTDVITAHQAGVRQAVATMGTALTSAQAKLLHRYSDRVVLAYDQDYAGRSAALRGIGALLEAGLEVLAAELPPETDPDKFIRTVGPEDFLKVIEGARPFFEVYVEALCRHLDASTFEGKGKVLEAALPLLQGLSNLHWRGHLIKELAEALDLPDEEIVRALQSPRLQGGSGSPRRGRRVRSRKEPWGWGPEEHVLYFVLHGQLSPARAQAELEPQDFTRHRAVWEALVELQAEQGAITVSALLDRLEPAGRQLIARLSARKPTFDDPERAVQDALRRLKRARLDRAVKALQRELRRAEESGDRARVRQLQATYWEQVKRRARLNSDDDRDRAKPKPKPKPSSSPARDEMKGEKLSINKG